MAENLVRKRLLDQRRALLDLSVRNRLINVPIRVDGARTIEIIDEKSPGIYRALIEGKGLTFLSGRTFSDTDRGKPAADDPDGWAIPQPPEREGEENGVFRRRLDVRLQTRLSAAGLQKRLFDIWYDAGTFEEEQGVNILFLAIGILRWFEDDRSDVARHAPLILLPVRLDRASAADRFILRARDEPAAPNLSIQAKLREEFGLVIEDFADEDEVDVATYLARTASAVAGKVRWKVLSDAMMLGLFSSGRLLMYRDLDPANWPAGAAPHDNPLVAALLGQGFARQEPIAGGDGPIDDIIPPAALNHVVDADASQSVAIEEALRGRNLVIKGAPGTGKSQTITNIIAGAVLQGKKILFVAEKMTALEVVQRRLRQVGLGPMTLELYSATAGKRAVLNELRRTRDIASRPAPEDVSLFDHMADTQAGLNHHAAALHEVQQPSGLTAYRLLGHLLSGQDGGGLPGFELTGALGWTAQEARMRLDLAAELAGRRKAIGDPAERSWRGVRRDTLAAGDRDLLAGLLHNIEADLETVGRTADAISRDFSVDIGKLADFDTLARAVKGTMALPPQVDRSALAGPVWRKNAAAITELLQLGRSYRKFADAMALAYRPRAWRFDLRLIRDEIAGHNVSWMRFLKGPYRDAMEQFRSLLAIDMPADRAKQVSLLDGMISAQEARRRFDAQRHLGAEAFGTLWLDDKSDWDSLQAIADWWRDNRDVASAENFAARPAVRFRGNERGAAGISLAQSVQRLFADLGQLQQFLHLDLEQAFGVEQWADLEVAQLTSRLRLWLGDIEALTRWIAFGERCRVGREMGLGALVDGLCDGRIAASLLAPTCERAYYEALRDDFFERLPDLKRFDGELQDLMVESFRVLDHGRIALARETIATRHLEARPANGGNVGPLGVLNAEFAKRRNYLPIRQLLHKAGPAIQQLKPVLMMSPLSVSQFLKPGALTFDLLVIDEASQIEPLHAFGAIARARQVVVVGDERQLPPSRCFAGLLGEADEPEEEQEASFPAQDAASVLELCLGKGMPARVLDWHYRSRHQALIAVSNSQFYGDRLMMAPSPVQDGTELGLFLRYLPQHHDGGNARTDPREARAVAEAVIAHARNYSEYRETQSLGVVTLSIAQRQAILRELELLRQANPESETFFNSDSAEPFFVKNLENVQGDERDVIFISIGYGRDAEGHLATKFEPLGLDGGERRLNVLISRARYRCEVFSSITAEDIDAGGADAGGVPALRAFLDFARNGRSDHGAARTATPGTLFDEAVAAQLRARGHTVATRIGNAGFHVDLAVADPERPGRYVLAIECDGPQYRAARSTRDRDRLRHQVLESQGWIVHRIWSVDWFLRPEAEIAKVEVAIVKARLAWQQRDDDLASPSVMLEPISRSEPDAMEALSLAGSLIPAEPHSATPQPAGSASNEAVAAERNGDMPDTAAGVDAGLLQSAAFKPAALEPGEPKAPKPRITVSWPSERKPVDSSSSEFGSADFGAALFRFPEFKSTDIRAAEPRRTDPQAAKTKTVEAASAGLKPGDPIDDKSVDPEAVEFKPTRRKPAAPDSAEAEAMVFDAINRDTDGSPPDDSGQGEAEPGPATGFDAGEPVSIDFSLPYPDFVPSFSVESGSSTVRSAEARPAISRSSLSQPYVEAVLRVSTRHELQELSAARMAVYVAEVVRVEGPVHEQEIIARIRGAFGLGRAGVRVREAVLDGIDAARITGRISGGPFYMLQEQAIAVRDRSQTTSPGLRKLEMLPPQEIEAALVAVIKSNMSAPRDALLVAVSRALGFAATSAPLRERLEEILDAMLARRELAQRNNVVVAAH